MKKLMIIVFAFGMFSCGNGKEATGSTEEVVEEVVPEVEVEEKNQNKPVEEIVKDNLKTSLYKYPFEVKGKTVNIELYNTLEELEKNDFNIGITQEQFFDTETYFFVFNSKPSSNGAVVKVSGRLYPILSIVLNYPMKTTENLVQSDVLTCKDSTLAEKILVFDSSASTNEVVYDSVTGCIEFKTTSQDLMGTLGDKFFYEVFE